MSNSELYVTEIYNQLCPNAPFRNLSKPIPFLYYFLCDNVYQKQKVCICVKYVTFSHSLGIAYLKWTMSHINDEDCQSGKVHCVTIETIGQLSVNNDGYCTDKIEY